MGLMETEAKRMKSYFNSQRFKGITRLYSAEQIVAQQGTIKNDYTVAKEASIKFYRDIIEFEQGHTCRLPEYGIDITFFKLPGGDTLLELIHYDEARTIPTYEVTERGILRHIAFTVDDVDAVAARLKRYGIEPHFGPINLPNLGIRVILIKDPNDVEVEFCQHIPPQK